MHIKKMHLFATIHLWIETALVSIFRILQVNQMDYIQRVQDKRRCNWKKWRANSIMKYVFITWKNTLISWSSEKEGLLTLSTKIGMAACSKLTKKIYAVAAHGVAKRATLLKDYVSCQKENLPPIDQRFR